MRLRGAPLRVADHVGVRLRGGLGNQMFQYAAARAVAIRRGAPLLLDAAALTDPDRPFALGALSVQARLLEPDEAEGWDDLRERGFRFDPAVLAAPAGTRLDGFFQSERYFADHAPTIRAELAPAAPPSIAFFAAAEGIAGAGVSVHVRRGDYLRDPATRAFHGLLGRDYYARALEAAERLTGASGPIFLFSDEPEAAAELLDGLARFTVVSAAAPWEELHLMALCRVHIAANSSFSWWGAWLDPRPDKLVIAPSRWASPEAGLDTRDLHPPGVVLV